MSIHRAGRWTLTAIVTLFLSAAPASAQVPYLIRYQGQTVDTNGVPLEGPYTLTFRLYDAATGGTKVWEEIQPNVPLSKGHFSVLLGQIVPLAMMDWSQPCWLTMQMSGEPELVPRQQITSVPLAIRAEAAERLTQAITPALITPQGPGSSLDADTVDGKHAAELVKAGDAAGGDLSSTYPNPTVSKIRGQAVSTTPPSDGQVLTWNAASSQYEPQIADAIGTFRQLSGSELHIDSVMVYQDIPGASVAFAPQSANSIIQVYCSYSDKGGNGGPSGNITFNIDGVIAAEDEGPIFTSTWDVLTARPPVLRFKQLSNGSHTIKVQARKTSGSGTYMVRDVKLFVIEYKNL